MTCAQYATPGRSDAESKTFQQFVPERGIETRSEMEDDAGGGLEVVLVLAVKPVEHVIAFDAQG